MNVRKLVFAGICTAAGIVLTQLFHLFGISGNIFLPMHLPVLLCGLFAGPAGGICGVLIPLLCCLFTGKPLFYPTALCMMFELGTYGVVSGLLSRRCGLYPSLLAAMLAGRMVNGAVHLILLGVVGTQYTWLTFLTASFTTALPGVFIQIILLPPLVYLLRRAKIRV